MVKANKEWNLIKKMIILDDDEYWVQLWCNVSYIGIQRVIERETQLFALDERSRKFREKEIEKIERGQLVLTNKKLLWLEKRGRVKGSLHLKFVIALEDVLGVYTSGRIFKNLCISDGNREYKFTVKDTENSVQIIHREVNNIKNPLSPPRSLNIFCAICKQQLTWIQQYNRLYCYSCKQYVELPPPPLSSSTKVQDSTCDTKGLNVPR